MTDKTEHINRALNNVQKAMREIDTAAYVSLRESTPIGDEFKTLEDIYSSLEHAKTKIILLKE